MSEDFGEPLLNQSMSLFRRKKLIAAWEYNSPGVLWRLHPSGLGLIIGEERDIEKKSASFFCVDQFNGQMLWRGASFGDAWWVGIEAVHEDVIFLHGFASPDLPEHRGVIAVDVPTGRKLWENNALRFLLAHGGTILAARPGAEQNEVVELDRRSGEQVRSLGSDPRAVRRARQLSAAGHQEEMELPVGLGTLLEEGSDLSREVQRQCGTDLTGEVEGIDHGAWLVFHARRRIAGSIPEQTRITHVLSVMDKASRQVVLTDVLRTGTGGVVEDAFFIHRDMLYYVKERKQLIAVRLALPSPS